MDDYTMKVSKIVVRIFLRILTRYVFFYDIDTGVFVCVCGVLPTTKYSLLCSVCYKILYISTISPCKSYS